MKITHEMEIINFKMIVKQKYKYEQRQVYSQIAH